MIPDILPVNNYVGNSSSTTFDFDFYIDNTSELEVFLFDENEIKTKLIEDIDYTVHEVKNPNGSFVTFPIQGSSYGILDQNHKISLSLSLPLSQETEYTNSSLLNLNSLEYSLDYLTRLIQIISRKLDLCAKVEECSADSPLTLIDDIKLKAKEVKDAKNLSLEYLNQIINYSNTNSEIYQYIVEHKDKFDSIDELYTYIDTATSQLLKIDGSNLSNLFSTALTNNMSDTATNYFRYIGMPNYDIAKTTTANHFYKDTNYTAPYDGWVYAIANVYSRNFNYFYDIYNPSGTRLYRMPVGRYTTSQAIDRLPVLLNIFLPKDYTIYIHVDDAYYAMDIDETKMTAASLATGFHFIPAI